MRCAGSMQIGVAGAVLEEFNFPLFFDERNLIKKEVSHNLRSTPTKKTLHGKR